MINIGVQATRTGPLFNGATSRHIALAVDQAEQEIATIGANHLAGDLGVPPFKNPTGWYRDAIAPMRVGPLWIITDNGVEYGEWLAGTSSRNRTTRFKGYNHWRRAITFVHRIAQPTTDKIVKRALGRS